MNSGSRKGKVVDLLRAMHRVIDFDWSHRLSLGSDKVSFSGSGPSGVPSSGLGKNMNKG